MDDQEYLREQIYNSLNLQETEQLVEMWQAHDSEQWTDLAFDVVKGILQERLGELPPQAENGEEADTPADDEERPQTDKLLICPYCEGSNVFRRSIELRDRTTEIILKKPETNLIGSADEYDEIVGFACEDCGYVFFMLKDFA